MTAKSEQITMPWIPTSERKPDAESVEYDVEYLIVAKFLVKFHQGNTVWKTSVEVATYNAYKDVWLNRDWTLIDGQKDVIVTHWMPLPSPPSDINSDTLTP